MKWLFYIIAPFLRVCGHWHFPYTHPKITYYDCLVAKKFLKPGDILFSYKRGEFTNLLISSEWKHAAMYVGEGMVVEAVSPVARSSYLEDFMMPKDRILLLRSLALSPDESARAAQWALTKVGVPYDFYLEPGGKAFYCTELVGSAINYVRPHLWIAIKRFGRKTYTPDDFLASKKKWLVLAEFTS